MRTHTLKKHMAFFQRNSLTIKSRRHRSGPRSAVSAGTIERLLDMWAAGVTTTTILQEIRKLDGTCYTERGLRYILRTARRAGDPRATTRAPGTPVRKLKEGTV